MVERSNVMSDVVEPNDGDVPQNPFIKRLLRNYRESAERSLEGPTPSLRSDSDAIKVEVAAHADDGAMLGPDSGRVRMISGLVALSQVRGDPHRRLETSLDGEHISCFVVGGERRLCVPQMLNSVLSKFTLSEIHTACDALRIHISLADDRQLTVLRRDGVLPETAHGCGLVTLTDAQRLCGALLGDHRGTRVPLTGDMMADDCRDVIPVMHRCFGKCAGSLWPSRRLVCCSVCCREFDVQEFVCHSHGDQESRTCHWGFDAANWRAYLQLAPDVSDDDRLQNYLDYFKDHADVTCTTSSRKRHEVYHATRTYTQPVRCFLGFDIWGVELILGWESGLGRLRVS